MILKFCLTQNRKTYDFETLPEASVTGALQSVYNYDPRLNLTYFMARSAEISKISGERLQDHWSSGS